MPRVVAHTPETLILSAQRLLVPIQVHIQLFNTETLSPCHYVQLIHRARTGPLWLISAPLSYSIIQDFVS